MSTIYVSAQSVPVELKDVGPLFLWEDFSSTLAELKELTSQVVEESFLFKASAVLTAPLQAFFESKKIVVKYHPILLLCDTGIPKNTLQLTGPNDPRLNEECVFMLEHILEQVFDIRKTNLILTRNSLREEIYIENTSHIVHFLAHLNEYPEKYRQVLKFMLIYELLHIKKQKDCPIGSFWNKITCYFNTTENTPERTPFAVFSNSILSMLLVGGISVFGGFSVLIVCFVIAMKLGVPIVICVSLLRCSFTYLPYFLSLVFAVQTIFDTIYMYRVWQREREICQEAIQITNDPEAAKIFYRAVNNSKWADSWRITKSVGSSLDKLFGIITDREVTEVAKKSIKQMGGAHP